MNYSRFNRHENMNDETRSEIMDLIKEVRYSDFENSSNLENKLYGLFDGYLYEEIQLLALELPTQLGSRIIRIFDICKRYPQSETQVF